MFTAPIARSYTTFLVEIILSIFCAVLRWNLLMNYVAKQLNRINHTKLYWSVYKQCLICTDERDMPVCRAISRGLSWLCDVSSWLQISSLTISTFSVVRTDFGRPLPGFLAVYRLRLSQFSWLDNQQFDVSTSYLEILLSSALSPNLYECADYRSYYGPQHSSAPLL